MIVNSLHIHPHTLTQAHVHTYTYTTSTKFLCISLYSKGHFCKITQNPVVFNNSVYFCSSCYKFHTIFYACMKDTLKVTIQTF